MNHVNGQHYEWSVKDSHISVDHDQHVLAFIVDFDDGTSRKFVLGNDSGFVRALFASFPDPTTGAIQGSRIGKIGGVEGMAAGAVAGAAISVFLNWIGKKVLHHVTIEHADYYDDAGRLAFRGPPLKLKR